MTRSSVHALIVGLLAVAAGTPAEAQAQTGKPVRVGFLTPQASTPASLAGWNGFRDGMRQLGWVEGRNVLYEYRSAEGKFERLPELARELAGLPVDVIVALNTPGGLAAKRTTTAIPIVVAQVGDPVAVGLVSNLARPGGNITGFANLTGEITAKRIELLAGVLPARARIALIANPDDPIAGVQIKDAEVAAKRLRIDTRVFDVRRAEDLEPAFDAMRIWQASGAVRLADPLVVVLRARTVELASRHRLPMMHLFRVETEAGGMMSYGADPAEPLARAPEYVDRILKGARVGDLPVQRPARVEFVINLKAARSIGLVIPGDMLARADAVIQ